MKARSLLSSTAKGLIPTSILLSTSIFSRFSEAISFQPAPSANIDLTSLGRIGLAGDFDAISLYQYEGQRQGGYSTDGSHSILARYPDGGFASVVSADGTIQSMCPFILENGTVRGVIVAGNFTSLGGVESQGAALFDPETGNVTALPGISGQISALYCDKSSNSVYMGGSFRGANSTNAIAYADPAGWTNLPFLGFNGPVTSIAKSSSGTIVFGGSFSGLGNATSLYEKDEQVVNLSGAKLSAVGSTTKAGFTDPTNIVCKTSGADGAGNTWLLADNTPGYLSAEFGFGFRPTKLRLYNTHQDGRGTKQWRFTAMPLNGILNFTYIDPATGVNSSCTSECPLSNDPNLKYQDFYFVNTIGMNAFHIDISQWYGNGGGLNGIELFQDDIYAYAVEEFNEPSCVNSSTIASKATITGPWKRTPSYQSVSEYLSLSISGNVNSAQHSIDFLPHIKQSGNYSVNIYTPGCKQDNTCGSRGRVTISGAMDPSSGSSLPTFSTELWQTNEFDKYDQIYFGYIEAGDEGFRPSVTLAPSSDQNGQLTVVAQRVGFTLIDAGTGGLNNLFEYDPAQKVFDTASFAKSAVNKAGVELGRNAKVQVIASSGDTAYIAGKFTGDGYNNICSIQNNVTSGLPGGGLNGAVSSMFLNATTLYLGGNFTDTAETSTAGLKFVAAYNTTAKSWQVLGAGVNGGVQEVVPLALNLTEGAAETVISFTGNFTELNAFGDNKAASVSGFAIWVPSRGNWLQNLNVTEITFDGQLTAAADLPNGGGSIFAGSLTSFQVGARGAAALSGSTLTSFPIDIQKPQKSAQSGISKRATADNSTVDGVVTGHFYERDGRNVTVLAGHFEAASSNGTTISNLAFINGANEDTVSGINGLDADSTFLAVTTYEDTLFAGGAVTGTIGTTQVNGIVMYDLQNMTAPPQPPALGGDDVTVYDIAARISTGDVYVAGSFEKAGTIDCPGVCMYSTKSQQWSRPGNTLTGTANALMWQSEGSVIAGGSIKLENEDTTIAFYNAENSTWSSFNGAANVPGPVVAFAPAVKDSSEFWVAGVAKNGSSFLMKYDGKNWKSLGYTLGEGTTIRGLQIMPLSENHDDSDLMPKDQALLLTGALTIPTFGNASAALFNGTAFVPYAFTSLSGEGGGSISKVFSQQNNFFDPHTGHLRLGVVIVIALFIALAIIFLLVIFGALADRYRRKRDGYQAAPTSMIDKTSQIDRLPPEELFGNIGSGRAPGAPAI